jgi:hypothetical protein
MSGLPPAQAQRVFSSILVKTFLLAREVLD